MGSLALLGLHEPLLGDLSLLGYLESQESKAVPPVEIPISAP